MLSATIRDAKKFKPIPGTGSPVTGPGNLKRFINLDIVIFDLILYNMNN
jgi:hypothetical protein